MKAIEVLKELNSALSNAPEANVLYLGKSTYKDLVGYQAINSSWSVVEGDSRRRFRGIPVYVVNANHHIHATSLGD